jgi:alanine racemase
MQFFKKLCSFENKNHLIKLHLKVDTGMHRIGISPNEIYPFISLFKKYKKNFKLNGIWTHFPSADSLDKSFSLKQIERFKEVVHILKDNINDQLIVHAANSAATINLPESYFDMVRIGLGLYGYQYNLNFSNIITLQPAVTWKTRIICIKQVNKGESIGYGRTFITNKDSIIGTIPVGYADGYDRLLSNKGFVLVNGKRANIVGRVCMDQTMIDLTDIPYVYEGTEVVLLGGQRNNSVSMYSLCELLDTIPHEILVKISQRVHRIYKY